MRRSVGKLPLQVVMTVPFVLLIGVTVGLAGYLAFHNGQNAVNTLASQLHGEVTARIQQHLDAYLATPMLINKLNLDGIRLEQLDVHNLDALERHFLTQTQRFDSVISLAYANDQREYVGAYRQVLGVDLGTALSSEKTGYTLEVYRITPQGRRELIDSLPNYDPSFRPWYRAAVQAGGPTWTPIFIWPSGDVGLDAVVPIYAEDGTLMGVLDSSLTLTGIGDFLQSLQVSKNGETFIVDRAGLLVAASTIIQPYTRRRDMLKRLSALESDDAGVRSATRHLIQQFGTLTNIHTGQQFYFDMADGRQFAQVTPYHDKYGLDWLTVVIIPESDFMAQINTNNRNTVWLIGASLLAAIAVAALMARWVTWPISQLNQSARALAQGDWKQQMTMDRRDEVGELAVSFNYMAEQLQVSFAGLQESETRYQSLFEDSPIALLEEDFSALRAYFDRVRESGPVTWRAYFEQHPDVVRSCMAMIKIIDANRAALELLKCDNKEKLLTTNVLLFFGVAPYKGFPEELISLAEGNPAFEAEAVRQTLAGDKIYVHVRLSIVPGYEDTWSKVLVSLTDITERKQAEEELLQLNQELMVLNDIAIGLNQSAHPDVLMQTTLDKVLGIIRGEAGWIYLLDTGQPEKCLTLAAQQSLAQPAVQAPAILSAATGLIGQVLQAGQPVIAAEVSGADWWGIEDPAGAVGPGSCALLPLKSHDRTVGVLGICHPSPHEFTAREVHLLTAIGHQMGVVIENMQLTKEAAAATILREIDRLRSELIANVSHELRTPLGLIKIFATSLLRKTASFDLDTREKFLQGIEEETIRLEEIVDNLLDLSRIENGPLRLDRRPADLAELVRKTIAALEPQLGAHRVEIELPLWSLMAEVDAKRLEQVLRNLLSNAIKYSPAGSMITIQGKRQPDQVYLSVRDEGIGIPAEEQGRIFERFYRVDNEATRRTRGAGLGLAVCQEIVGAHGGQMGVESSPGCGSTFWLMLPVTRPAREIEATPAGLQIE